jgi:hypothetical protein
MRKVLHRWRIGVVQKAMEIQISQKVRKPAGKSYIFTSGGQNL